MNTLKYLAPYITNKFRIVESGCWEWTASKTNTGYGVVHTSLKNKSIRGLAHRVSYTAFKGDIPEGKSLDHLCRNTICINPSHLEPVTHRENIMRSPTSACSLNAKKTHCKKGHEYTKENTYHRQRAGRRPERDCLTCRNIRNKERVSATIKLS